MEFKASEIDLVIEKLIDCDRPHYFNDFQQVYFEDWKLSKVKSIFKYLVENHGDLLDYADNSKFNGYCIQIGTFKELWKSELEKGGFTAFWKEKELNLKP